MSVFVVVQSFALLIVKSSLENFKICLGFLVPRRDMVFRKIAHDPNQLCLFFSFFMQTPNDDGEADGAAAFDAIAAGGMVEVENQAEEEDPDSGMTSPLIISREAGEFHVRPEAQFGEISI